MSWQRRFFTIWIGQAVSLLGSNLVQFAIIWYLTERTGSATVLAFAALVGMLPQIMFSPIAGAYVDRWKRQRVLIGVDSLIAAATIILAILFATGVVQIWHIYCLLFVRSAGGAFHWPAMQASTTLMVPEEHLARIAGMNQTLQGVANIFIPPLGAVLLELIDIQLILAIDVATALVAIVPLFFVTIPQYALSHEKPSVVSDVRQGLTYLWHAPGILLIALQGIAIRLLMVPAVALMPLLVSKHFGGDAVDYAGMQAAAGIGMIIGGVTLSLWGGFKSRIMTAMLALIIDGIMILIIGIVPSGGLLIAMAAMFGAGMVEPIILGSTFAVAQAIIPAEMQGRIFGLLASLGTAAVPIGLALAGPVADTFGIQSWFILGGIITAIMGISAFFIPAIMQLETRSQMAVA